MDEGWGVNIVLAGGSAWEIRRKTTCTRKEVQATKQFVAGFLRMIHSFKFFRILPIRQSLVFGCLWTSWVCNIRLGSPRNCKLENMMSVISTWPHTNMIMIEHDSYLGWSKFEMELTRFFFSGHHFCPFDDVEEVVRWLGLGVPDHGRQFSTVAIDTVPLFRESWEKITKGHKQKKTTQTWNVHHPT